MPFVAKPAPPTHELASAYATRSIPELRRHYKVGLATLFRWLLEAGIPLRQEQQVPHAQLSEHLRRLTAAEKAAFKASGLTAAQVAAQTNMGLFDAQQVVRGRATRPEAVAAVVALLNR